MIINCKCKYSPILFVSIKIIMLCIIQYAKLQSDCSKIIRIFYCYIAIYLSIGIYIIYIFIIYIIEVSTTDSTELLQSKFKYIPIFFNLQECHEVRADTSVSCNNLIGRALLILARITNDGRARVAKKRKKLEM